MIEDCIIKTLDVGVDQFRIMESVPDAQTLEEVNVTSMVTGSSR